VRVFLAVPSDPLWVDSARGLVETLRKDLPRASWTRAESWHVTLLFLGDVDEGFVGRSSKRRPEKSRRARRPSFRSAAVHGCSASVSSPRPASSP
jgi:2'-5' RNA ligase